ncbi:MAG: DNA-binding protein WhiA [Erysipelotrichaceae bacterium]|nr:DNA-binding protein WhiA [Erysipelotrichaceae bacterium]
MSFTTEIKQEISYSELKNCCARAELSSLIQLTSSLSIVDRQFNLLVRSENPTTAKRILALLKKLYKVDTKLTISKKTNLRKNNVYTLRVKENVKHILIDLGLYTENKGLLTHPTYNIVSKDCCCRAYIAGAFIAYGSCNPPTNSNYHLEISLGDIDYANFLVKLISRVDNFEPKISKRRNRYIVYIKRADAIADFLKLIGAQECCLNFENIRIDRDFVQSQKRVENCYIANEVKTLKAAEEQVSYMNKIKKAKKEDKLDEKLRAIYDLRLKYQDASLNELAKYYEKKFGYKISKSGLKHRLNKIEAIAKAL